MRKSLKLKLSTKDIARIALLFLDGDAFENVIPERWREFKNFDDLDYNEDEFNQLKIALMKVEQLSPGIASAASRKATGSPSSTGSGAPGPPMRRSRIATTRLWGHSSFTRTRRGSPIPGTSRLEVGCLHGKSREQPRPPG